MAALDLGARVAWVRHVVHKDIDISTRLSEFTIDELEDKKPRLCATLAYALMDEKCKNMGARQQAGKPTQPLVLPDTLLIAAQLTILL